MAVRTGDVPVVRLGLVLPPSSATRRRGMSVTMRQIEGPREGSPPSHAVARGLQLGKVLADRPTSCSRLPSASSTSSQCGRVVCRSSPHGPDVPIAVQGRRMCNDRGAKPRPSHLRSAAQASLLSPRPSTRGSEGFCGGASGPAPQSLEYEKQHPASFYCPISRQCMHDPVVLTDGHTYERRHIEQWLKEHHTSPVSGAQLESKHTFPNHALRNAIEEYFEKILRGHRKAIQQTIRGLRRGRRRISNELLGTIDSLMQCSILVNADLSIERVLKYIMDEAKNLVGAEVASVFLMDEKSQELYSTVNSTGSELRIPISSGVAGRVASSGAPLIVHDAYTDKRFNTAVDEKTGFKTRNIMCVPIQSWKWGIIGVAQLINKTSGGILSAVSAQGEGGKERPSREKVCHFTDDDQHFFQVLASQAAVAIVNSGFFELEYAAVRRGRGLGAPAEAQAPVSKSISLGKALSFAESSCSNSSWASSSDSKVGKDMHSSKGCSGRDSPLSPPRAVSVSPVPPVAAPALARPLLQQAMESWQLDTLALSDLTAERPLSVLFSHMLGEMGFVKYFDLNAAKLARFLEEIEKGYSTTGNVLYHNRAHAASVLHFTYAVLVLGGVAKATANAVTSVLDADRRERLVTLAALFAAAVHDYDHIGLNNDFLVKGFSERALRHNDKSVNESHHVCSAFEVLHKPECNFLEGLPLQEYRQFRSLVINLVLGTDMSEHKSIVDRLKDLLFAAGIHSEQGVDTSGEAAMSPRLVFTPASTQDAALALQVALKCADLGHLALSWNMHVRWVQRLEQEFFAQGDREKESSLHDAVSFLMDRNKPGVSQSQVGFFSFVALPVFRAFVGAFPQSQPMLVAVEENFQRWQTIESGGSEGSQAS